MGLVSATLARSQPFDRGQLRKHINHMNQQHLNRVEDTLTEVLTKLNPVHEHAAWVDGLRGVLHRWWYVTYRVYMHS